MATFTSAPSGAIYSPPPAQDLLSFLSSARAQQPSTRDLIDYRLGADQLNASQAAQQAQAQAEAARLAENGRQFDVTAGMEQAMRGGQVGLGQQQLGEQGREFDVSSALDRERLNNALTLAQAQLGQHSKEFDVSSAFDRQKLAEAIRQRNDEANLDNYWRQVSEAQSHLNPNYIAAQQENRRNEQNAVNEKLNQLNYASGFPKTYPILGVNTASAGTRRK